MRNNSKYHKKKQNDVGDWGDQEHQAGQEQPASGVHAAFNAPPEEEQPTARGEEATLAAATSPEHESRPSRAGREDRYRYPHQIGREVGEVNSRSP